MTEVPQTISLLAIIGAVGGLTGGLFGVGGSVVMIPALTEALGPDQHLYQAAAMIVNFFVAVPAVYHHWRMGAVDGRTVSRLIPLAVFAVLVGVGLSELPFFKGEHEKYLRAFFGLFLLLVSAHECSATLRRKRNTAEGFQEVRAQGVANSMGQMNETASHGGWRLAAWVAVPAGIVAGLLGVGGGLLAVPLQRRWLKCGMKRAIANSSALIVAISSIGALFKNWAYAAENNGSLRPLPLAAILIPSAFLGSYVGSRLMHRLAVPLIRVAFYLLLVAAAGRLIYGAYPIPTSTPASANHLPTAQPFPGPFPIPWKHDQANDARLAEFRTRRKDLADDRRDGLGRIYDGSFGLSSGTGVPRRGHPSDS